MKHIKVTYFIVALLVVSMQWSCSKDDDRASSIPEQGTDLADHGLKGLSTIVMDGKTINYVEDFKNTVKNAFSVHLDYINETVFISTNEEEAMKHLNSNPKIKTQIEADQKRALAQTTTKPFMSNDQSFDEFNGKVDHSDDHDYRLVDNHVDSGFFIIHKSNVTWVEGLASVPNTSNTTTFHWISSWRALRDVSSSFNYRMSVLDQYGYTMTIRNPSPSNVGIVFFDATNYSFSGGYNYTTLIENQHVDLPDWFPTVDGTNPAGSIQISYF
jgi:hypothetical protein